MATCEHLQAKAAAPHHVAGCEDCLKIGGEWVHLRACLSCGHVACCDSSPNQHASKHARSSGHPAIRSMEPGESWLYCYVDDAYQE